MPQKSINIVLAEALRFFMGSMTNVELSRRSDVAEATIRNYLSPTKRMSGKSGKEPSAKLTEIQLLAVALGVTAADLVTDATDQERAEIHRARAASYYVKHGRLPDWAPAPTNQTDPAPEKRQLAACQVYTFTDRRRTANPQATGDLQGLTPLARVESIDGAWGLF